MSSEATWALGEQAHYYVARMDRSVAVLSAALATDERDSQHGREARLARYGGHFAYTLMLVLSD